MTRFLLLALLVTSCTTPKGFLNYNGSYEYHRVKGEIIVTNHKGKIQIVAYGQNGELIFANVEEGNLIVK